MSGGPMTIERQNYINQANNHYLNISFTQEDWCSYKGHCRINQVLIDYVTICLLCKYRKRLDIPTVLEDANNERIKNDRTA